MAATEQQPPTAILEQAGLSVEQLYDELTERCTRPVRLEELVYEAAERVPGLVPTRAEMEPERARKLADKEGLELGAGAPARRVPREPAHRSPPGRVDALPDPARARPPRRASRERNGRPRPRPRHPSRPGGRARAVATRATSTPRTGTRWTRPRPPSISSCSIPRSRSGCSAAGWSIIPRYAGERIFGAGINLTLLYLGQIDYLFYVVRDMGYVNKIYRGLAGGVRDNEKLWIAAVERYAIGGACQLLHVMDHVIAVRGSRLYLPARKEGIIPGASNLRLPRFVGDRAARQAILSGREWTAGDPDADLICDEIVEAGEIDGAIDNRIEALTSSGLVNAAANRAAMRTGEEPLDLFREYMATYAREQAYCQLSPALVRNLEEHWNADRRRV